MGHSNARRGTKRLLGTLGVAIFLLAFAAPALAGPPTHLRKEALDVIGLDHACGVAVDSNGDVYASSAGDDVIKVFDPAHIELATIPNANEPCGLAVNGKGELFVSEKATGNVVRYKPNAFPFAGTPTYGAAEPIASSGEAEGIAVDPFNDRLYVAAGDRVSVYDAAGNFTAANEVQQVSVFEATGGTFELSFEGAGTGALPYDASASEVELALEAVPTIGAGNVEVEKPASMYIVTFVGTLALTDVDTLGADASGLEGPSKSVNINEVTFGFSGHVGEGELGEATGVAAYTYPGVMGGTTPRPLYLSVADAAADQAKIFSGGRLSRLQLRRTIDGVDHDGNPETPLQQFGFGAAGAYLSADPGNEEPGTSKCAQVAEQACTTGHFFLYDAANDAVDEFDATGEFVTQVSTDGFADAEPTPIAVERSGGPNDGTIYVGAGAGAGAKLLAFGPLVMPARALVPALSRVLGNANSVATDFHGNVYVGTQAQVRVFSPEGVELTSLIADAPRDLAVDSAGNVYAVEGSTNEGFVTYHTPAEYPPVSGTTYSSGQLVQEGVRLHAAAVDPSDDHLLVLQGVLGEAIVHEFRSADEGSSEVTQCGSGLSLPGGTSGRDIDVHGATGTIYVTGNARRVVAFTCDGGGELLGEFKGSGCPSGEFGGNPTIAVDQSNGHVIEYANGQPGSSAREYDAAGACLAEFGTFSSNSGGYRVAVDNSCALHDPPLTEATALTCKEFSPANGTAYVAFDSSNDGVQPFDLNAFGPLSYGEAPIALSGSASGIGPAEATLNGTVDPRSFELDACTFQYLTDADYQQNIQESNPAFQGASSQTCVETPEEIGKGDEPVAVHAGISGLETETTRYRFRLMASNMFGESGGKAMLFGPPTLTTKAALPIGYDEVTLKAGVNPAGLETTYHFEYGTDESYGQSTPPGELPPGESSVAVQAPLVDLAEGATYHFRIVAENEAARIKGPDQTLVTLERAPSQDCENAEYRTGLSSFLPDCRAYELVTPAETRGLPPVAQTGGSGEAYANSWFVTPRGPGAGESVAFAIGALPGFDGTGRGDGFRAQRSPGAHPKAGWVSELYGFSFAQGGGSAPGRHGIASDQRFWLWSHLAVETPTEETFPLGNYLRTPSGQANPGCSPDPAREFELVGCAGPTDPNAEGRHISAGGTHLIFTSKEHLEAGAAPAGTEAIYDRGAGEASAEVVSVKPDGSPFAAGEHATYIAAIEDGSTVAFRAAGALYLHHDGITVEVAAAPNSFAGISEDGKRAFYTDATHPASVNPPAPADLFVCAVEGGSCAGPEKAQDPIQIASDSIFVNVSPDGSRAFFTSDEVLPGVEPNENGEEAEDGERNLYAWEDTGTSFVAILAPADFTGFTGEPGENLGQWITAITGQGQGPFGRASSPTRSTPDGDVLLFQSHAQLTDYDNEGHGQIYRYAPSAAVGERLLCVSCNPSNSPASADALLQSFQPRGAVNTNTLIANVTDDGQATFFQSPDPLLPEDANSVVDVYQWKAPGAGSCKHPQGCLALISSGQGEKPSYLYGMSADGSDVVFQTPEKLVGQDIAGSPSLYDARVGGGIPDPPLPSECQGDACQGTGTTTPALPAPASATVAGNGNIIDERKRQLRCPKGKRRVRGKGKKAKARCVKRQAKRQGKKNRAKADRGARR